MTWSWERSRKSFFICYQLNHLARSSSSHQALLTAISRQHVQTFYNALDEESLYYAIRAICYLLKKHNKKNAVSGTSNNLRISHYIHLLQWLCIHPTFSPAVQFDQHPFLFLFLLQESIGKNHLNAEFSRIIADWIINYPTICGFGMIVARMIFHYKWVYLFRYLIHQFDQNENTLTHLTKYQFPVQDIEAMLHQIPYSDQTIVKLFHTAIHHCDDKSQNGFDILELLWQTITDHSSTESVWNHYPISFIPSIKSVRVARWMLERVPFCIRDNAHTRSINKLINWPREFPILDAFLSFDEDVSHHVTFYHFPIGINTPEEVLLLVKWINKDILCLPLKWNQSENLRDPYNIYKDLCMLYLPIVSQKTFTIRERIITHGLRIHEVEKWLDSVLTECYEGRVTDQAHKQCFFLLLFETLTMFRDATTFSTEFIDKHQKVWRIFFPPSSTTKQQWFAFLRRQNRIHWPRNFLHRTIAHFNG